MEQLPTPHNNFFQFALSQLPNARNLIETQLSEAALAELDLESLRLKQVVLLMQTCERNFPTCFFPRG
jgi:hypothetical protein